MSDAGPTYAYSNPFYVEPTTYAEDPGLNYSQPIQVPAPVNVSYGSYVEAPATTTEPAATAAPATATESASQYGQQAAAVLIDYDLDLSLVRRVFVVPMTFPVDGTHFLTLSDACTAAGAGGTVTVEPGSGDSNTANRAIARRCSGAGIYLEVLRAARHSLLPQTLSSSLSERGRKRQKKADKARAEKGRQRQTKILPNGHCFCDVEPFKSL